MEINQKMKPFKNSPLKIDINQGRYYGISAHLIKNKIHGQALISFISHVGFNLFS